MSPLALLRAALKALYADGWAPDNRRRNPSAHGNPARYHRLVRGTGDNRQCIEIGRYGTAPDEWYLQAPGISLYRITGVAVVVDGLAAVGLLPPELTTPWHAAVTGFDSIADAIAENGVAA